MNSSTDSAFLIAQCAAQPVELLLIGASPEKLRVVQTRATLCQCNVSPVATLAEAASISAGKKWDVIVVSQETMEKPGAEQQLSRLQAKTVVKAKEFDADFLDQATQLVSSSPIRQTLSKVGLALMQVHALAGCPIPA